MDVQPTNLQQLRDAIMPIWTKISEECFQHLVESVSRRIKTVLKAKGGPTRYQQGVPNKVASECVLFVLCFEIRDSGMLCCCCFFLVWVFRVYTKMCYFCLLFWPCSLLNLSPLLLN